MSNLKELTIPGFIILNRVYQNTNSLIYRGIRTNDNKYVILKTTFSNHPPLEKISALQNEYHLLKNINIPGVVQALDLIKQHQQVILVLNDIEGITLQEYLAGHPITIDNFFTIVIQLTEILSELQQQRIIHKDIKPSSIIIQPETLTVELIDFSISSHVDYQVDFEEVSTPNELEGSLPYMSPEQTGRINRRIDYRSDLYSLGITMFEMLTGQLPFQANDPLEWVHAHLAKTPINILSLNSEIPSQIADIINMLLAKTPEERYSSAAALKEDLLICKEQWSANKSITKFPLNTYQLNDQLQISQKLYGRENQIEELMTAFNKASQGNNELVFITGKSGIGKSSLIKELQKPVVRQRGYFISGKFDQLRRNLPYSAIIQACQNLIQQALIEPDYKLSVVKTHLLKKLGSNAELITNLIPDLELIIGKQPKMLNLNPVEKQKRLLIAFQQFVEVFSQPDHPLVISIDDLQWADGGSLALIESLLTNTELHYVLIICAYRETEVDSNHPLMQMISNLERATINFKILKLENLNLQNINHLLADSFKLPIDATLGLATLIDHKTQGNPFFINEFIKNLYREKFIYFSYKDKVWNWNVDMISAMPATQNVVDMLINNIKKMPESTQNIIKYASCIGFTFNLNTLSLISKTSIKDTLNSLKILIEENYIQPTDKLYRNLITDHDFLDEEKQIDLSLKSFYRFSHDRIQQAAYALIPEMQNKEMHLSIARLLIKDPTILKKEKGIFEVTSHYNRSIQLISDPKEKIHLAKLNLKAGRRAKSSNAYEIAIDYLLSGTQLLSAECWYEQHKLTFNLFLELAECENLLGRLSNAESHFNLLLKNASSKIEKANVYRRKAELLGIKGQFGESIRASIKGLSLFNIKISENPSTLKLLSQIITIRFLLRSDRINHLQDTLQPINDPELLMIDELINKIVATAYFYNKKLLAFSFFQSLILSLKNGYSKNTSIGLMGCAFIFVTRFSNYKMGFKLVEAAKYFENMYDNKAAISLSRMGLGIFVNHFQHHSLNSIELLKEGYQAGYESGEIVPMVYSRSSIPYMLFYTRPLPQVAQDIEIALPLLKKLDIDAPYNCQLILKYIVNELRDIPGDIGAAEANNLFTSLLESKNNNYICLAATFLSRYYLLMDDILDATKMIEKAFSLAEYHEGALNFTQGYVIHAICIASTYSKLPYFKKLKAWRQLLKIQKKLAEWTKLCPANFEHNYYLVTAEMKRLEGKNEAAETYYNLAIDSADNYNYIIYSALAHERAAKFFLSLNKTRYTKLHFMEAYYNYLNWGANKKCRLLEINYDKYVYIETPDGQDITQTTTTTTTTSKASIHSLDYLALLKSMQILASEIELDQLLKKLVNMVVVLAGAKRGVILAKQGDDWLVEAEGNLTQVTININQVENITARHDLPLSIISYAQRTLKTVVIQDASVENEFSKDPYLQSMRLKSILVLPILYQGQLRRILYLENDSTANAFTPQHIKGMQLLISQAAISLENAKFYHASNLFVPHTFLQHLNRESLVDVKIGDQVQRKMSVLFCDIQGFTSLSEKLPANEVFKLVCEFLGNMEPIISRHGGFIDKYIGDAIMALFDSADDALQAAIAMHQFQQRFNETFVQKGHPPLEMGIGINTGELILGMVGSAKRMDGSVIGDSVNIASRVESLTRTYHVPILITEETRINLKNSENYQLNLISDVRVKGKEKPINVWAVETMRSTIKITSTH